MSKVRFLRDPWAASRGSRGEISSPTEHIEITREKLHIVVCVVASPSLSISEGVCARSTVCVSLCIVCAECSSTLLLLYLYSYTVQQRRTYSAIKSEEKKMLRRCAVVAAAAAAAATNIAVDVIVV